MTSFDKGITNQDVQCLKEELTKKGVGLPADATVTEIDEIYDSFIVQKQLSEHADHASQVMFPVTSSAVFQGAEGDWVRKY
eukprot:6223063-Ditylum_brightwellii.AAC.1